MELQIIISRNRVVRVNNLRLHRLNSKESMALKSLYINRGVARVIIVCSVSRKCRRARRLDLDEQEQKREGMYLTVLSDKQ